MRLIDADALIGKTIIGGRRNNKTIIRYIVTNIVQNAPTVDAVPVIRCKECKHCRRELAQGKWEGSCRYWNTHSVMLNDFCSRAERKEE